MKRLEKKQEIVIANKTRIEASFVGKVCLQTTIGGETHDIIIKEALHIPELTTNLLSVSQLIKNGNSVHFGSDSCLINNERGELVAKADLIDNVYRLNTLRTDSRCFAAVADSNVWHRRFGHVNGKYLEKLEKGAVIGMAYRDDRRNETGNCVVCYEGKQARLPFPKTGYRAASILETIHADVCGPMETLSIGGSRYFLLFVDDYCRMTFVYFLKTKDEVVKTFTEYKNLVENQKGVKIKTLRTDNGGEFCNSEMKRLLAKHGIVHQTTNSYTPEQNGMAERMNRTVVEKGRCLLFEAELEKKFWAEAVNTAVYLKNRTIAAGLGEKTPYEMWYQRKPDVSNLRIFGSIAMVHVAKPRRLKWDKKS